MVNLLWTLSFLCRFITDPLTLREMWKRLRDNDVIDLAKLKKEKTTLLFGALLQHNTSAFNVTNVLMFSNGGHWPANQLWSCLLTVSVINLLAAV